MFYAILLAKRRLAKMEEKLVNILNEMAEFLNIAQMKKLQEVLLKNLAENELKSEHITNSEYLKLFLDAKRIEGCSDRTLEYYRVTVEQLLMKVETPIRKITTEELRKYLVDYQKINNCSNVTVDNIRRNISSFFSWLEEEDFVLKSPMRRIHKIKTKTVVKEVISDEGIEKIRDGCHSLRDLAIIDLLYSTGIRVGELVNLDIENVNFEYIVMGIEGITFFSKEQDEEQGCSIANYYEYKHEVLFYLRTMLLEVKTKDVEYQSLCQNLLEVLIINLMRRAQIKLEVSPVNKANKDCVFIEKYIDAHFKEDITLDKLSELTFLNKYHIVHAFKQYKGISPISYMIQKRIHEAKILLSTTNLQISEISYIVGFTSQSYFAQAFKKSVGISPLQYRKDHSN